MVKNLQNILTVSSATMLSRVLGLIRDVLTVAFLGLSTVASSFVFAFTIPNLFRRLLGEGALTSAFIPVFTEELNENGKTAAFQFLNGVITWVTTLLIMLVVIGSGLFLFLSDWLAGTDPDAASESAARWMLGFKLGAVLMPYMLLICLSALFAAVLNVLGKFAVPALSPVLLNLAMIAALVVGGFLFVLDEPGVANWLCAGVLLGGLLQFGAPAWVLYRSGWRPKIVFVRSLRFAQLIEVFIPGILGASILQVNTLVSRSIALGLEESAVAALYYANRLVELPLGVFAIAITTVIFPQLSAHVVAKRDSQIRRSYIQGIRLLLAITVPAAVGLIVLGKEIIGLLFQWGSFDAEDVVMVAPLLTIFSASLPFYALSTYLTRAFHAYQDMRTPVKVSIFGFVVNIVLSLLLMFWLGIVGLALANCGSFLLQTVMLQRRLREKTEVLKNLGLKDSLIKIALAAITMGLVACTVLAVLSYSLERGKLFDLIAVVVVIPISVAVYFGALWLLRFEEREEFIRFVKRRS